jgi:hypothetical protein
MSAFVVVFKHGRRAEIVTTIPMTLERATASLREQVATAGSVGKTECAFSGEGEHLRGWTGDSTFWIMSAMPAVVPSFILTVEIAKRLRQRGLLLPAGDGQQYETPDLQRIALLQTAAMMQMDQLDKELQSL